MSGRSKVPNGSNLRGVNKRLQTMAKTVAIKVAARSATRITSGLRGDYDSGRTAYGAPRPLGVDGNRLDLVQTGKTRSFLKFLHDGTTRLSAFLATRYARYLIGKYAVLPNGNAAMPEKWRAEIRQIASQQCERGAAEALGGL